MARLVIVAPDDDPPADPPKCRHLGCIEPGTEVTELVRGRRSWDLRHCVEHKDDGLAIARSAGFLYDDPAATPGSPMVRMAAVPDLDRDVRSCMKSA